MLVIILPIQFVKISFFFHVFFLLARNKEDINGALRSSRISLRHHCTQFFFYKKNFSQKLVFPLKFFDHLSMLFCLVSQVARSSASPPYDFLFSSCTKKHTIGKYDYLQGNESHILKY